MDGLFLSNLPGLKKSAQTSIFIVLEILVTTTVRNSDFLAVFVWSAEEFSRNKVVFGTTTESVLAMQCFSEVLTRQGTERRQTETPH